MSDGKDAGVPGGYLPVKMDSGFAAANGDFFWRQEEGNNVSFGTRIAKHHCNPVGTCHGGWIATYLDLVLPLTGRFTVPECEERFLLTVNLTIDYLDPAYDGDWLEGHGILLRKTKRMVFVQGLLKVGDRLVARGSGILRIGPEAPRFR